MGKFKFIDKFLKSNLNPSNVASSTAKKMKPSSTESNLDSLASATATVESNNSEVLVSNARLLNEHLICNCCFEILNNPISLLCGHSFCQLCLANW